MTANVSIQATLNNSANNFVISWELASGGGIINSIAPLKPYGNPFQVNIPGLTAGITYIIKLWESVNTTPTGSTRNSTNVIASATTTILRADDYLVADQTPNFASNTTSYVNASYVGWSYDAERVSLGTQYPQGAPNVTDPDYSQDLAGGFHLIRPGDKFQPQEKWVIRFQPQVAPATAGASGPITSGEIITGFTMLTAADMNKALFIQGATSNLTIGLPPLSSVADWQWLYLYSAGGSHISAFIIPDGTDTVRRYIPTRTMILCQNEQMRLFKANGVWNVDSLSSTFDMTGEIIYRYNTLNINGYGYNAVPADGRLLDRNDYNRLFGYLVNSGITPISETAWNSTQVLDGVTLHINSGGWTLGTDGTNFRVPDLRTWFLRATDTIRGAGSGQWDAMLKHKHAQTVGLLPGAPNGEAPPPTGPNMGLYKNPSNLNVDLSSLAYNDAGAGVTGTLLSRTDFESRPRNIAVPILIRI